MALFVSDETYQQAVAAYAETGNKQTAADKLGWNVNTLKHRLKVAASRGIAPEAGLNHPVAEGFVLRSYSHYTKTETGEPIWIKADADKERQKEAMDVAVAAMCKEIKPVSPIGAPTVALDQLLTQYTFTDFHLGALCWHREGGADWDVSIAYDTGIGVMKMLVEGSPQSSAAVVNIQGDFLHADGILPVTPSHGHILDADSRFGKVVDVAIKLIRHLVALALEKHESVTLLVCEGNHDISSSIWLRKMFMALYENEPRVSVNDSDLPYYVIEHGNTMLAYHHGHLKKNEALPLLFAAQFAPLWGRTTKRYANTGHRHHAEEKEHSGMTVIQHPTLAARDAYAARGGWFAERAATAITFHKQFGRVGTNTATPEMLQQA